MDFKLISEYPILLEKYEKALSDDLFKNYRKEPPVFSLHEIGEITLIRNSKDEKNGNRRTSFIKPDQVSYFLESYCYHGLIITNEFLDHGDDGDDEIEISDSQIQKLLDYMPFGEFLPFVTNHVEEGLQISQDAAKERYEWKAEEERWNEGEQQWLEDQADAYDPYGGDVPPDLSEGDEPEYYQGDDYSGYAQEHEENKLAKEKEKFEPYQMAYEQILSEDWFKNYRINPPASSFQELGDFSSYDEFEIKINSLIVDLFNKNNFQSSPYQKLFDYLPLEKILKLIINLVRSTQLYFVKPKLKEKEFLKEEFVKEEFVKEEFVKEMDENSFVRKLDDNETIPSLSQIRTRFIDVKADGYFCIECIVLKIPERREIHTKSGESIPLSQIFVEDDTGQLWVRGWRNQAKLIDKCELGDIISITGLNAKENNLEKGRLELFLTSNSTISFKSKFTD